MKRSDRQFGFIFWVLPGFYWVTPGNASFVKIGFMNELDTHYALLLGLNESWGSGRRDCGP
jgi:hypothetical protein